MGVFVMAKSQPSRKANIKRVEQWERRGFDMIILHNLPMCDISCLDNDIASKVVCFYKEWNQ